IGGGVNGIGNHGLRATAAGSTIQFSGGSVAAQARGSFGALAEAGGVITLLNGAQVSATRAQTTGTTPIGSHALFATGTGRCIGGTGITAAASGPLANAARAQDGGLVVPTGSTIGTTGAGTIVNPSAAARAVSGGVLQIDGSTLTATGQFGHGVSVQ